MIHGRSDGPLVFFLADLAAARAAVESTAKESPVEFAAFVREADDDPSLADRALTAAKVIGTGAAIVGGASWLRGRIGVGATRAAGLGVAKTAMLGGRMLRDDGANLVLALFRAKAARAAG